jgi:release factor glutamine methyltransferase
MEEAKEWLVVELLKRTSDFFTEKEVDEPRLCAELLLGRATGLSRLELYLQHSRAVSVEELESFRALCRQRLEGRPVQYILGEQYFYGLVFTVDERVLVPRPETELLVEHALESLGFSGKGGQGEGSVLDIGTGSGCIGLTMAKLCPSLSVTAVDCSLDALAVARLNAALHGVESQLSFVHADMFDEHFVAKLAGASFNLIISNPPYIPEVEWRLLQREVRDYEPKIALTTLEGVECYRAITELAVQLLVPKGKLCFELHADGADGVSAMMEAHGFSAIQVYKDYAGLDRVIAGTLHE